MGTFSKIKKYSKPSLELDEKIECLDKELKKTLGEAIANSTGGVYSITQYTEPQPAVPPTYSDVPDTSGITGNSFTQPTNGGIEGDASTWDNGWANNNYLKNSSNIAGETDRPIVRTVPNSPYGGGGAGIVMYGGYFGTSIGYITSGNQYKQILVGSISGGTENPDSPNARIPLQGGVYGGLTDAQYGYAVSFWRAYRQLINTYGEGSLPGHQVKVWISYNRFHHYQSGGEFATWTGGPKRIVDGDWQILQNVYVIGAPQTYQSNPGSPYQPGYTTLLQRYGLGDPNYYPGPVQPSGDVAGLGPYEVKTMLDIIRGTPGTPDAQRARDTLDRWAKPGSRNRETLIKMGILEQASAGGKMGDIASDWEKSGNAGYGDPRRINWGTRKRGGPLPLQPGPGYKDPWDDNDPSTWPSIKNQVKGA